MIIKLFSLIFFLSFSTEINSQKKLSRPDEGIGIESIDSVVSRSFNLYDLLLEYEDLACEDRLLSKEEIIQIEKIFNQSDTIYKQALEAEADFKNENLITRLKATVHLERAKRAISYCRLSSEEILKKQQKGLKQ